MGVVNFLTDMNLFMGQPPEFFKVLKALAIAADDLDALLSAVGLKTAA